MPLPSNYKKWPHLLSVLLNTQNRIVREEFSDLGGDDWSPDITTPRGSLRHACTLNATDSAVVAVIRLLLYYAVLEKLNVGTPVYGIPITMFQSDTKFLPQVKLFFLEDRDNTPNRKTRIKGEISFRIAGTTSESLSQSTVNLIADRIRGEFASGGGYVWEKGKKCYTYRDFENGLNFIIWCQNKSSGQAVIQKVLRVLGLAYNEALAGFKRYDAEFERYPANPGVVNILGKTYNKPVAKPNALVRFQYAVLHLHGVSEPIALVDRAAKLRNPIHRVS